jgi:hypothetical protein
MQQDQHGQTGQQGSESGMSKIRHTQPRFGETPGGGQSAPAPGSPGSPGSPGANDPVPMAGPSSPTGMAPKIRAIETGRRHEEEWSRTPNTTGQGAIHVKTFQCKLTADALAYMDQTINEWLDAHPQYEVKFVNSTVGVITGKLKEPALICQVWV